MIFTQYKKQIQALCWILFALHIAVMVYFLFFADMLGRTGTAQIYNPNLILFREIRRFWIYRGQIGFFTPF